MNYKLTIQYDGSDYAGWQIQKNAVTVQQILGEKIDLLVNEKINLIGSGRTDSGVHALGQVANFRTSKHLDMPKFIYSLNSMLPNDIAVSKIESVGDEFHSRFDAKRRIYLYFFSEHKSPFFFKYTYHFNRPFELDLDKLNRISRLLEGKHDFTSFARKDPDDKDKRCEVFKIGWKRKKNILIFRIEADRFLHGMVRTIAGTLLHAAKDDYSESYLMKVMNSLDRTEAAEALPARGLFLYRVVY